MGQRTNLSHRYRALLWVTYLRTAQERLSHCVNTCSLLKVNSFPEGFFVPHANNISGCLFSINLPDIPCYVMVRHSLDSVENLYTFWSYWKSFCLLFGLAVKVYRQLKLIKYSVNSQTLKNKKDTKGLWLFSTLSNCLPSERQ